MSLSIRGLLLFIVICCSSSAARANDFVFYAMKICNKGEMPFDVAYVSKIPGTFSDDWEVNGWYAVTPSDCKTVWQTKAWEGGFTVHHPEIHVAIAFRDSAGDWGPVKLNLSGRLKSNMEFCASQERFDYKTAPRTTCRASEFLLPVSADYDPAPRFISGAWGASITSLDIAIRKDDRVVKVIDKGSGGSSGQTASSPSSSGSGSGLGTAVAIGALALGAAVIADAMSTPKPFQSGTLNAVLLEKQIVRRASSGAEWYYADGSHVNPIYGLQGQNSSYLFDAPAQHSADDPDVASAEKLLEHKLVSTRVEIENDGRFFYLYPVRDIVHNTSSNLWALDFARAKRVSHENGIAEFDIPCKENSSCVIAFDKGGDGQRSDSRLYPALGLFFNASENGQDIWDALLKLRGLYPAAAKVDVR